MLLSYNELVEVVDRGIITNVNRGDVNEADEEINAASIDLRLGDMFFTERPPEYRGQYRVVDLSKRESVEWENGAGRMIAGFLDLAPGEFILTHTLNKFHMPDDMSAQYSLKSSLARNGLNHLLAGWIDPGFNDSVLTLELKNNCRYHTLRLKPGMPIGQIIMFRHDEVPQNKSYRTRGRYNSDMSVSGIKP
jgi:dCTP deaminase